MRIIPYFPLLPGITTFDDLMTFDRAGVTRHKVFCRPLWDGETFGYPISTTPPPAVAAWPNVTRVIIVEEVRPGMRTRIEHWVGGETFHADQPCEVLLSDNEKYSALRKRRG
jgi:hypothetical protein